MAEEAYIDTYYEHFLKTTGNDEKAAALLTLAMVIADRDEIGVYLAADPDSGAIRVSVEKD
jgi:hypothetical protein